MIGDREPSRALVDCLAMRSRILANLGRVAEAAASSRRALAMARELDYPSGQVHATTGLVIGALRDGHLDEAAQLARQSMQIPDIPGTELRGHGYLLAAALAETGDLAAAEQACAATLAQARDAGDMVFLGDLLRIMAGLDLRAGRTGDAAAHLREAARLSLQTGAWLLTLNVLRGCGHLCAATGRPADAVTVWAAWDTFNQQRELAPGDAGHAAPRRRRRDAREALGPDRARAAEQRGAAMSMATAAEYALMLTAPDPPPAQAAPGAARLSARERELVTLVAQGRTDAQIAAPAVHQHPDRPLAPGPDPGQDRLPPPRRPDPPGPHRRYGLAVSPASCLPTARRRRVWVVLPRPSRSGKGVSRLLPRACQGGEPVSKGPRSPARDRQAGRGHVRKPRSPSRR